MKIIKIDIRNIHITPTDKKFKRARVFVAEVSGLSKGISQKQRVKMGTLGNKINNKK